jgi:hypothetical protein
MTAAADIGMVEQLLTAGRPGEAPVTGACDQELLLAAIAGTSDALGWHVMRQARLLVALYNAAADDVTAEQIARCATSDDNLDWYFLFHMADPDADRPGVLFSINKIVASLAGTARGRLAMQVVAHTTVQGLRGRWVDDLYQRLLLPVVGFADDWTLNRLSQTQSGAVSTAAARELAGRYGNEPWPIN